MELPPQFVDLSTAYESPDHTWVNIIGVVVDIIEPRVSRTNEHMFTVRLLDRKLYASVAASQGLKIRFFLKDKANIPRISSIGDVVLIRGIKVITYANERIAVQNKYPTGAVVFPHASIPDPNFSIAFQDKKRLPSYGVEQDKKINLAEQDYVIQLKHDMATVVDKRLEQPRLQYHSGSNTYLGNPSSSAARPPAKKQKLAGTGNPKFRLIEEIEHPSFADIVVVVIKKSLENYGCDFYVTDYTVNKLLRDYPTPEEDPETQRDGDAYGYSAPRKKPWPGPYGCRVLKVNLKPPHGPWAYRNVDEGEVVLLRNTKTRMAAWMTSGALECDMWPDDLSQVQVNVRKNVAQDSVEYRALVQRQEAYWNAREAQVPKSLNDGSKPGRKHRKQLKKQQKRAEKAQQIPQNPSPAGPTSHLSTNPHVRCMNEEIRLHDLEFIQDSTNARHTTTSPSGHSYILPFINAKYRTKVRIVDYEPKNLEEFAVRPLPEAESPTSDDSMDYSYDSPRNFEWYFSLQLESASASAPAKAPPPKTTKPAATAEDTSPLNRPDRLWVHVHHEQATFLLGNSMPDEPEDLRANPRTLARLREKMFVLWGNLEEITTKTKAKAKAEAEAEQGQHPPDGGQQQQEEEEQALINLPFECCLMEYGVEIDADDAAASQGADNGQNPLGWRRMYALFGATIL